MDFIYCHSHRKPSSLFGHKAEKDFGSVYTYAVNLAKAFRLLLCSQLRQDLILVLIVLAKIFRSLAHFFRPNQLFGTFILIGFDLYPDNLRKSFLRSSVQNDTRAFGAQIHISLIFSKRRKDLWGPNQVLFGLRGWNQVFDTQLWQRLISKPMAILWTMSIVIYWHKASHELSFPSCLSANALRRPSSESEGS